ncbi:hydroxyethylthiazole kinase [Lactococcus nasutitermitis]|uniref:Hydroxyethylthiazole kinase n=1 Tax=Lactococcus nasutitermitis TaxID=1652957 RepID=A0ABV9JHR0_9LACT|nr:hydroxyethylthiazole kinase [Lactococcus nasutitermitis]
MSILLTIQEKQPLVLNLANSVTQQHVADAISFLGASPLMTRASNELEELLSISSALVLNTGTINEEELPFFITAAKLANKMHKPVILDPVAVMMPYRASFVSRLIAEVKITIIRGNAAEIAWFAQSVVASKGIDALDEQVNDHNALKAARQTNAVIVQTGRTDTITDGKKVLKVNTHSPLFKINVGCGDMLSAIIGAFASVSDSPLEAAFEATQLFGEAGELASTAVNNLPGNFVNTLLDTLYQKAQNSRETII